MEQYYTVSSAKRLGGQDSYGNITDSVFFENETSSALWKHAVTTDVSKGTKVYGIIEDLTSAALKPYRKFTKRQVPEDSYTGDSPVSSPKPPQGASNSGDGARQGMAINNAAAYVTRVSDNVTLEPKEFADEVRRYAKAIYHIDLNSNTEDDIIDLMS